MALVVETGRLRARLEQAFEFAQQQVRELVERDPGYYPMYTRRGKWRHDGELWTNWCDGFLPGMMWVFYRRTGERAWRELAIRYTEPLEERKHDRAVHDLNFVLGSSIGRWHELEPSPRLRDILCTAGETMALRFRRPGGYLRSFISDQSLFIDIMMNVGIVFWAAEETGSLELRSIADQHCLTTRRCLVRGDGSTAHEGIFDLDTGEFIRQTTHQGYRGDSCWVRGLAWSLYGFAVAYRFTGDARYLATSRANAECFLTHTPSDGITPYDYDAPDGERPIDTSGTAIGAAGLLKLAAVCDDGAEQRRYREAAAHLIASLCRPRYLACETPGWEGILREQIYHLGKGLGVGESCMFGEHFFVEAVDGLLGLLDRGEL